MYGSEWLNYKKVFNFYNLNFFGEKNMKKSNCKKISFKKNIIVKIPEY